MTLAAQWKAFEHKILKNSLEKHCYEELVKSHPLKDRLTRRREFMRPSLAMQVKRAFAASNEATRFIKYLPALGED
ncbi:hypothetical protein B9Z55_000987 [Caenorhabditis nigoni]|uniref:Uncharacterized protein n=1 Tax=Caenorhabditis nigoni TaxID=1611254 RepID=A0A2G5VWH3_9PELO|nr:hypothetical protein B9Z55_000987 [Caenorhabditis nigoni]